MPAERGGITLVFSCSVIAFIVIICFYEEAKRKKKLEMDCIAVITHKSS